MPTAIDLVNIDSNPTVVIASGDTAQANEVNVGYDNCADLTQSGGTANFHEGLYIGAHNGSTGTYTMTGGQLNIGDILIPGRLNRCTSLAYCLLFYGGCIFRVY